MGEYDTNIKTVKQEVSTHNNHTFFSDNPSSQHMNRMNLFLMKDIVAKYFKDLLCKTWNFTEAGHGKGPMDGIRGSMRRRADEYISHGADVTSATDFQDSKIIVLEVTHNEVLA